MSHSTIEDPLVDYLLEIKRKEDRGALAALRSGLGKRPGEAPRMIPHVGKFLRSADPERPSVISAFLTASLFAKHPEHAPGRSLGSALWNATRRDSNPDGKHGEAGVESRLTALIDAHSDDIPRHLESLVSLCESAGGGNRTGIDWYEFRRDVISLVGDDEKRRERVHLRWARDFWQNNSRSTGANSQEGTD